MTGGHCVMQLVVWGLSPQRVQGSVLVGAQGAMPPEAPRDPTFYSTKRSQKSHFAHFSRVFQNSVKSGRNQNLLFPVPAKKVLLQRSIKLVSCLVYRDKLF